MSLEDELYAAILYYTQEQLASSDPDEIYRVVWEVVDSLRGDLLIQGQRVIDELIESEDGE